MKRKILSLALIAALVFALSVSAFAEQVVPSGVSGDVLPDSEDGTIIYDAEQIAAIEDEVCAPGFLASHDLIDAVEEQLASVIPTDKQDKVEDIKLELVAAFEFGAPEGTTTATFTNVAGVKAGDTVVVLHKNGGAWEVLPATVTADGTVVVTNASGKWSPVAIVLATVTYSNDTTPTNPTPDPVVTSPQTSDIG